MVDQGVIKVSYVDHMGSDLTVVNAARISFAKEADELKERDKKLIKYLADNEHMSPFEHCVLSVIVECPLFIRSQIHRHRTFAYNEISRRYTSDGIEYYFPEVTDFRKQSTDNKQASHESLGEVDATMASVVWQTAVNHANLMYEELLKLGLCREQARGVLPQCLMTKFYMSGNLRNWAHYLALRSHGHAQKEVRVIAQQTADIVFNHFPVAAECLKIQKSLTQN